MAQSPDSQINDPIFDKFEEGSEISSRDTVATPDSEFSPPSSPPKKNAALDPKTASRRLAASLSLEEQVGLPQVL
jgi:beta-glucosidase